MREGLEDLGAEASLAIKEPSVGSLEVVCLRGGGALDSAGVGKAGRRNTSAELTVGTDLSDTSSSKFGGSGWRVVVLETLSWDCDATARDLVEAVILAPTGGIGLVSKSQSR